jgi:hypothetical protein
MPATSYVDASSRLVITLCANEVTQREVEEMLAGVREHRQFQPDFRQLVDLTQVSRMHLHFRDLYELKDTYDPFSNEAKRAVVATDTATFGISRMYQLMVNSPQFEIFRSLQEAMRWLGVDATVLERMVQVETAKKSLLWGVEGRTVEMGDRTGTYLEELLMRLRMGAG